MTLSKLKSHDAAPLTRSRSLRLMRSAAHPAGLQVTSASVLMPCGYSLTPCSSRQASAGHGAAGHGTLALHTLEQPSSRGPTAAAQACTGHRPGEGFSACHPTSLGPPRPLPFVLLSQTLTHFPQAMSFTRLFCPLSILCPRLERELQRQGCGCAFTATAPAPGVWHRAVMPSKLG